MQGYNIGRAILALTVMFGLSFGSAQANEIQNGSFEIIPGPMTGQGFLPSPWVTIPVGADTYSNDGSFGLFPSALGNFTGVVAFDGIRWAAGWSAIPELFGQPLTTPLIGGQEYRLTGALHQALRADLDHPGGYDIYVSNGLSLTTSRFLVNTGLTLNDQSWETFSVTFTTPLDVGSFSFLLFNPIATTAGAAYPGVDLLDLELVGPTGVPEPASIVLLGYGLIAFSLIRRRQTTLSRAQIEIA